MSTLLTPDEWIARYDKGGGPQDPFAKKASEMWSATPTPLFDEIMSKRKATEYYSGTPGIKEDETLFHEYVKKLIIKYPTNPPSDIRKGVYPLDGCGHGQKFAAGSSTFYDRFRDTEKALTLLQTYKSPWHGELLSRAGLRHILFETYYNHTAPAREEARKVAEAARIAAEEERKQTAEKNRIAAEEKAKNAALIAMYDL
jgi:hypothetical protein